MFLDENASEIDCKLAKKLDSVIVTNGDIKNLLTVFGKKFDQAKWFDREHYFLRVFNKLATRQLFEEVKATKEAIENMSMSFMKEWDDSLHM